MGDEYSTGLDVKRLQVTLQMILTVCPLVLLASAVDAIAGGGGLISLPAYLLTGISPSLANGSNKMSACVGSLTAMIKYTRGGKVVWKPALFAVAGALPGSFLGAQVLALTPDSVQRGILFVMIPVMAALMFFLRDTGREMKPMTRARLFVCLLIGLTIGFYDGFFGPGTGTLLILLFTYLAGMDMVTASGTSKVVNLSSNLAALVAHILNGNVLFLLALPAMACSIAGGYIGAALAMKRGAKFIRAIMLIVLTLLLVKLAYDAWMAR